MGYSSKISFKELISQTAKYVTFILLCNGIYGECLRTHNRGAHGLNSKHLQLFLDEFAYRFNRRKCNNQLFNQLLDCWLLARPITFPELVG